MKTGCKFLGDGNASSRNVSVDRRSYLYSHKLVEKQDTVYDPTNKQAHWNVRRWTVSYYEEVKTIVVCRGTRERYRNHERAP